MFFYTMVNGMTKKPDNSEHNDPVRKRAARDAFGGHKLDSHVLESMLDSLSAGVVAFDTELKIILANGPAGRLVELGSHIDQTLAKGTDSRIWGNWSKLLESVITDDSKSEYEAVKYELAGKRKLLHIVCTPLKDSTTGQSIGGAIVMEDVTEKVNIEHQLTQAERLAAVGKLASRVAHELNNPMDGVLRYINLTLRTVETEGMEKPVEYLQHCRTGLMRMTQIISELLEFSRSKYSAFENMPIEKVVADAVKAMEPKSKNVEITVVQCCPECVPKIGADSLFQVFCNLIKNAIDAMDGQGKLMIATDCRDDVLSIAFKDTGPGFAVEHIETIFKPFFTTKSHGKGTGLGLAICKDIVEKYDGRVTAENAPEGGSVFTVYLPLGSDRETDEDLTA